VDSAAIETMNEIDLRYGAALGNLVLIVNGVDCSAPWGWIPLVDTAVAFSDIREALAKGASSTETFEFTENESSITFRKSGDRVHVSTSYVACDETIPFSEFDERVKEFRNRVFSESARRFPMLKMNSSFQSLSARTSNA
jgi:hypothetical protein